MPKPRLNANFGNVLALCPDCEAITNFEPKGLGGHELGSVVLNEPHLYEHQSFSRKIWRFFRCANCNRGAVALIHDNGGNNQQVDAAEFLPHAIEKSTLPGGVPDDIAKEFAEAELDAAHGAYRSGSAMLRSVLEKTLTKNGYDEVEITDSTGRRKKSNTLLARIEAAAEDGVITAARKKRAHENIRVLGNDILHEDWREVKQDEFEEAHKYTQRILEDFYDDRAAVEAILRARSRLSSREELTSQ